MESYTKPQILSINEDAFERINAESGGTEEPNPTPAPTSVPASMLTPATYVCPRKHAILVYTPCCEGCQYAVKGWGYKGKACPYGASKHF